MKCRKLLSMLLVLCMLIGLIPSSAITLTAEAEGIPSAQAEVISGTCGGEGDGSNLTWTLSADGVLTISGTGSMKDYARGEAPWSDQKTITAVVIGEGATSIGTLAFEACSSLTAVELPDGLLTIGDRAFYPCKNLASITIPDSVTYIGEYAFCGCGLTSVRIPAGVTEIEDYAFHGCPLTVLEIPSNVACIGNYAFRDCDELVEVTIPGTVASVGEYSFALCDSLTTITVLEGAESIGAHAFECCGNLTSTTLPDSLTSIGSQAFTGSGLTEIVIPANVKSLASTLFQDCRALTKVVLPTGLTTIEDRAFAGCKSLTNIEIPDSVTSIEECAFYGCSGMTSAEIPDGITRIEDSTFWGCSNLERVDIPASVTNIGNNVFDECENLTIYYDSTEDQWNTITFGSDNTGLNNADIIFGKIPVSDITLNKTSISIYEGETFELTAKILPENATDKSVTWKSSDETVATVEDGLVTALKEGTATITAQANNNVYTISNDVYVVTCDVTVLPIAATDPDDQNGDGYHDGDVAVINRLIEINGLGWTYNDPASWPVTGNDQRVDWNTAIPKRIVGLSAASEALTGAVDLSGLTELTSLFCRNNPGLTALGISNLSKLDFLDCSDTSITELDVSKLTQLTHLDCSVNKIKTLDVSELTQLTDLRCYRTDVSVLDVSKLTRLTNLMCSITEIKKLDVSALTALITLQCSETKINELDVSALTNLTWLDCSHNDIAALDVSNLTNLSHLNCKYSGITELDVSKLTQLTYLYCSGNEITELNTADLTKLVLLDCSFTGITELDISELTNLNYLECNTTDITELDVSKLTNLGYLNCSYTGITELDVTPLVNLRTLRCISTDIAELNVSHLTNLTRLECDDTDITELDVSELTNLSYLTCSYTGITELDVSKLTQLTELFCVNTGITELDVGNLTNLTALQCSDTNITELDVANLTNLTWLDCSNTNITTLDISALTNLALFSAENTPLRTIVVPADYVVYDGEGFGALLYALPTPVRTGYIFTGWYTAETGGDLVQIGDTFNETTTLYSHWVAVNASNQADIDTVKLALESHGWTVAQSTANSADTVKSWIEQQIDGMELSGISYTVEVQNVASAEAGKLSDLDGTNGSFSFDVKLTKGSGDTYAETAATITSGVITATVYVPTEYTVTYLANGGRGTVPTAVKNLEGTVITVAGQGNLTNGRYEFVGWNTEANGTGIAYKPNAQLTVKSDVTLYAQWRITNRTVSGTITGHDKVTYTRVTAKLVSSDGATYIGTVDEGVPDGKKTQYTYRVNAPEGKYTLIVVATTDKGVEVTRTHNVNLKNGNATQPVNLPNGQAKAKSEVIVNQDAPQVLAGGLDDIVDKTIEGNDDVAAVEVTLVVAAVDETKPEAEEIRNESGSEELEFVELTILKEVTMKSNDVQSEHVTELGKTVELVIPFNCAGKSDIKVHRYHTDRNGSRVDTLTTTLNNDGEWIELGGDHIVIHAKKFSTYAIGYSTPASVVEYTVSFDANSGTGTMAAATIVENAEYTLPTCGFTAPSGKQFKAWSVNCVEYGAGTKIIVTGNVTVMAVWENIPSSPTIPYIPTLSSYEVVIPKDIDSGTISASHKFAPKGTVVTLTATPNEDSELVELTVTDSKGNAVALTEQNNGTFTFSMSGSTVYVDAAFRAIHTECPKDSTCPLVAFKDLQVAEWYHDGVHYCIENGLMNGTGADTFAPGMTTSRAMIITILWRLEGSPVVNYAMSLEDVPAEEWYTEAIRWAAAEGIVNGYGNAAFPTDPITREQMATLLYRYEQYKGGGFKGMWMFLLDYPDRTEVSEWAYEALCWTTMNGVINGKPGGILDPKGNATRVEAAAMLYQYCEVMTTGN